MNSEASLVYGILAGVLTAVVCSLIWAAVTVVTQYQLGLMAIAVGLAVGMAVRMFGRGNSVMYSLAGGSISLLGCILGNILSMVGFISQAEGMTVFQALYLIDPMYLIRIFPKSFQAMDVVFYGIAVYEGFRFSVYGTGEADGGQPLISHRGPILMAGVVLIAAGIFSLKYLSSGTMTYHYDSGSKSSEGPMRAGKLDGTWTYWFENGKVSSTLSYRQGLLDGSCTWLSENGKVAKRSAYTMGLSTGACEYFDEDGNPTVTEHYENGRLNGPWVSVGRNGKKIQEGSYAADKMEGLWQYWYENGTMTARGNYHDGVKQGKWEYRFPDGRLKKETTAIEEDEAIENSWAPGGTPLVTGGRGNHVEYGDNGLKTEAGPVDGGRKTGLWKRWNSQGRLVEENDYSSGKGLLKNAWNDAGKQTVKDGNGEYAALSDDGKTVLVKGAYHNGRMDGVWTFCYPDGKTRLTIPYKNGEIDGALETWFQSGQLESRANYVNGKCDGESLWYHENGRLSSRVVFKNGQKKDKQVFQADDGTKIKEEYYENGRCVKTLTGNDVS
jgi:antitoxin component YwqK of YwqJK toxin-antitoxin module